MARGRKGSFEYISNSKKVKERLDSELRTNLTVAIRIWQRALLIQMSGRRTGRMYLVPGTKTFYQASAPGESPAVRTGVLRRSYYTEVSPKALEAYLGSELDYSLWLERGTSRMEPRPAIEPAFNNVKDEIEKALWAPIKEE